MAGVSLFFDYVMWHYTRAFVHGATVWANFLWFVVHFFSIPLLLRTLFSPWKRMTEAYGHGGFDDLMGVVVVNVMTRIIGFLVRIVILALGLALAILVVVGFITWCLAWFLLPILAVASLITGFSLLAL